MANVVAPEAPKLEAKHFAAAMVDRASVDREVLAMQNLKIKKDGETVFQHEIEIPRDDIKEPNFKELHDIALEVDATRNRITHESRQSLVIKKLEDLKNIVTKETPLTPRQLKYVGEVAADIPAIIKSVAKDTGLTEAQVKVDLRSANPTVTTILTELCDSKAFIDVLSGNIGAIEVTKEMIEHTGNIHAQELAIQREKNDVSTEKKLYTNPPPGPPGAKEWYEAQPPANQIAISNAVGQYENLSQLLADPTLGPLQRNGFASAVEASNYKTGVDREISRFLGAGNTYGNMSIPANLDARLLAKYPGAGAAATERRDNLKEKILPLLQAYETAETIRTIYAGNPNFAAEKQLYDRYQELPNKIPEITGKENAISQKEATLSTLKTEHGKDVASIAGKIEKVMERSFKEYYNKSLLTRGKQVAEYDANHKTELKQKEADLKEKQGEIAKVLLDKYLRMSFLKYKAGKVVGWDDKGLKKLVKDDLFSHSPADMARELLRRVYDNRGDFPDTYKKEIDALCKDMGLSTRVTFNDVLKKMDTQVLADYAAAEMPKAFGYAKARGYYFDRLRLKKHQVEYITSTQDYGPGFFEKMLEEAKVYAAQMDNEALRKDVFRSIDVALKQLRDKTLGKDYQEGIKNALKAATTAAAVTAGTYFIGGPYTLGKVAAAVGDTAMAASAGATLGIRTAADFVDDAALQALGAMGAKFVGSNTSPGAAFAAGVASNTFP